MGKTVVITECDCGCGKTAQPHELDRWFTLTQHPEQSRTTKPKLGREGVGSAELYFASVECLAVWTTGAMKIIPAMRHDAAGIHPRGGFYSSAFPTLWF